MKKFLLLAIVCLPMLFGGCAKRIIDTTITIFGTVVDKETQMPLCGVFVTVTPGSKNKQTGDDGYFEFVDLEQRQYSVQAIKEGYKSNSRMVNYNAGEKVELIIPLEKE